MTGGQQQYQQWNSTGHNQDLNESRNESVDSMIGGGGGGYGINDGGGAAPVQFASRPVLLEEDGQPRQGQVQIVTDQKRPPQVPPVPNRYKSDQW
jgi:hypothetical protein